VDVLWGQAFLTELLKVGLQAAAVLLDQNMIHGHNHLTGTAHLLDVFVTFLQLVLKVLERYPHAAGSAATQASEDGLCLRP